MPEEKEDDAQKKRVHINELPTPEKDLTDEEEKNIGGGAAVPPTPWDIRGGQPTPEVSTGQPSPGGRFGQPSPE